MEIKIKVYNILWAIIINFRDLETEQGFLQFTRKEKMFLSQWWELTANFLDTKESRKSIQRDDANM